MPRQWLQFGPYRLDVISCALLRDKQPVNLTPKAIEMLRVLVRAGGSVVTKEMFLEEVWPGTFVEETSITRNISALRTVLGKDQNGNDYIETFPKRGYRLSAPVQPVDEEVKPCGKSLAVLPFRLLGVDIVDGSMGLRIADALITRLANVRTFIVRPTRVVSQFEESSEGRSQAGKDFDADFILDGTVQVFTDRIRVTVQLLGSGNGQPVWGGTFDEGSSDDLGVQDSLSEKIAGALAMFLSPDDRKMLSRKYTENSEAYQLYLRARFHWNRRSESGLQAAIQWFQKAIRLDPEYALAYSGLAASYAMLPMLSSAGAKQFMPKARTAALKAMDIDDSLVEAHAALAFVKWHYDWDWERAEREFKIALEFQPEHATIHQWYGMLLVEIGRFSEGIAAAKKAQALDPTSASIRANRASILYLAGRYQESINVSQESLALDPQSIRARLVMAMSLEQMGRVSEAIEFLKKVCGPLPGAPWCWGSLGHAYGLAGRVREANSVLKNLREPGTQRRFFDEALVSLGLGMVTETLELLRRACEEREFHVVILKVDSRFERLHSNPEFQAILARIWQKQDAVGGVLKPGH